MWTYKNKKNLAREFRKTPTRSEKILWYCLKNRAFLNLKFRRQHGVDGFVLDVYCHELRLAIEIDGGIHLHKERVAYDIARQHIIEQHGIQFFRVSSNAIEKNIETVLNSLELFIKNTFNR